MAFETAKKITQESGSNFLSSFSFLPHDKKEALQVIYAFCRVTDDIVDQTAPSEIQTAKTKLEEWRKETIHALRGKSENQLLGEVKTVAEQYKIPEDYFLQLIEGCADGLKQKSLQNL